jgi:hypothetical protein
MQNFRLISFHLRSYRKLNHHTLTVAFSVAIIASPAGVSAQTSATALRLWAGGGYGSFDCYESFSCNAQEFGEARGAINGFAGIGRSVTRSLVAGLELNARSKHEGTSTIRMRTASAIVLFYPVPSTGLHLKGTAGIGYNQHDGLMDDIVLPSDRNWGTNVSLGIGYDLPIASRISITPGFEIGAASFESAGFRRLWESRVGLTWQ